MRNTPSESPSELLTAREVADQLRLARRTVYLWAKNGKLDPVRFNGALRFRAQDIRSLLQGDPK